MTEAKHVRTVIVPNELADEINRALDLAYAKNPEAAVDRDAHFSSLLDYYDEHGKLPDFSFERVQ